MQEIFKRQSFQMVIVLSRRKARTIENYPFGPNRRVNLVFQNRVSLVVSATGWIETKQLSHRTQAIRQMRMDLDFMEKKSPMPGILNRLFKEQPMYHLPVKAILK